MQDEDRGVGRDRVEFRDRRQALLGELMLGEATDHAHPLRRRRHRHLLLQHGHGVGQAAHAVPAQLQVEVEAATDHVRVVVAQAWQHAPTVQVDHLGRGSGQGKDVAVISDVGESSVLDRDRTGVRPGPIERGELPAMKNEIGHRRRS